MPKRRYFRKKRKLKSQSREKKKFQFHLGLRVSIVGFILVGLFAAMLTRLWFLQILNAPQYEQAVSANSIRVLSIPPIRGLIYDRSGHLLVGNKVIETVTLDRQEILLDPQIVAKVAAVLNETSAQIDLALKNPNYSPFKPVPIATNVPLSTVLILKEQSSQFPGVSVSYATQRYYPYGSLDAQLLGHVGDISATELKYPQFNGYSPGSVVGQDGVESTFEKWLQGKPGSITYLVNSRNIEVKVLKVVPATPGDNVILPIDVGLQQTLDSALSNQIANLHNSVDPTTKIRPPAPSGAAVVMDVTNGQVIAMSSFPTYNPTLWVGGISQANYQTITSPANSIPALNRVIAGLYTPGSTFKIATATAALNSGLINANTLINDPGYFQIPPPCYGKCQFHNAGYESLGEISVAKAIGASDDVFFYTLGYRFWTRRATYGDMPIQNVAAQYGLGQMTGINLPGEVSGYVDSPAVRQKLHALDPKAYPNSSWYTGDNLEMAFGQGGTTITPIQLADAYATFANGGTRYQPQVGAMIESPNGKVVQTIGPKVMATVNLPPSTRNPMLQGFESAVDAPYGTVGATNVFSGFPLNTYPIAGKTGTASTNHVEPNALFVAFGPANAPKYVVAVAIDQGGYGAQASAPIARKVFDYLLSNQIPNPSLPKGT